MSHDHGQFTDLDLKRIADEIAELRVALVTVVGVLLDQSAIQALTSQLKSHTDTLNRAMDAQQKT